MVEGQLIWANYVVDLLSVCAKFQYPSLSRSGLKVHGGVVECIVEAHVSVQLKPKPS